MRNIAMLVSYDGTNYEGFQTQPSGLTIQDKLELAIHRLTGETIKLIGSGRTDAGVHAYGQVINFLTSSRIPVERWSLAMNSRLPQDIVVRSAIEVPESFHARRSAISKTYRYTIQTAQYPDVFQRSYQYHHPRPLNIEAMREGLAYLIGEHDFTSYSSPKAQVDHRVRTIYEASITEAAHPEVHMSEAIHIDLHGNGFLYNMVRIIVGTLIMVGQGKLQPRDMLSILHARDRTYAGPTAVAHGLSLWEVHYDFIDLWP